MSRPYEEILDGATLPRSAPTGGDFPLAQVQFAAIISL
jgi:hypothetical protein